MLASNRFPLTSLGVVASLLLFSASTRAQQGEDDDEAFDRTPRKCITTARIRTTDILDDRTIIFHMRGNQEVYRVYLPNECPGLARNDRFAYQARNSQICNVDLITVLEQIGGRLDATFTCRLGEFIPITREEAEELKLQNEDQGLRRNAIRAEPAEVPPEDADAQDAAADEAGEDEAAADEAAPAADEPRERRRRRNSEATEP
jgi:hypothetical protein